MNGLIDLYKPRGMSSAKAVSAVKRILGAKTVGHMGTLDPMAEGVLVIGVGKSARLFDILSGRRKTYLAKFTFGYETDTLDAFGTETARTEDIPSVDSILGAAQSLIGKSMQLPPAYSAKHVDGKRAYALAREGREVELAGREIEIFDATLVSQPRMNETVFSIECSAGTYIRSICRDIGRMCGSLATLTYLQRTKSGVFDVKDSITLEALEVRRQTALIPPEKVLGDLPTFNVDIERKADLDNGRAVPCDVTKDSRIYCGGVFYGIGRAENGRLAIKTYLKSDDEDKAS